MATACILRAFCFYASSKLSALCPVAPCFSSLHLSLPISPVAWQLHHQIGLNGKCVSHQHLHHVVHAEAFLLSYLGRAGGGVQLRHVFFCGGLGLLVHCVLSCWRRRRCLSVLILHYEVAQFPLAWGVVLHTVVDLDMAPQVSLNTEGVELTN